MTIQMQSRWGVQIEGDQYDLDNLIKKLEGAALNPSWYFISMADDVPILRTSAWDDASDASEVRERALIDVALLQGCLNLLDGCQPLEIGTVYDFDDGGFSMSRTTPISVVIRKPVDKLASAQDLASMLLRVRQDEVLQQAVIDFTPDGSWIDLYRVWESLKRHYGGEPQVYKQVAQPKKLARAKRTANSFRHIPKFDPVPDPTARPEAVQLFGDALRAAIADSGFIPLPDGWPPGTEITVTHFDCAPDGPASLGKLRLDATPQVTPGGPPVLIKGTLEGTAKKSAS